MVDCEISLNCLLLGGVNCNDVSGLRFGKCLALATCAGENEPIRSYLEILL